MKFIHTLLPLAALTSAFVLPNEEITEQLRIQSEEKSHSIFDKFGKNVDDAWASVEHSFKDAVAFSGNAFDDAINSASEAAETAKASFQCHASMMKYDVQGWLDSAVTTIEDEVDVLDRPHKKPKHPHHGHGPDHKPNQTVYQLISSSKYTTKLAKLINKFPDLVETLNGTAANYTVFAPTDAAFEKIPKHDGKGPSDELIKKVLAYHVSPDFYPAGRVLVSHTIPTVLGEKALGGEPQRLRVSIGLKGLSVNFYSRVVAVNIFGTNGVIHGVDSLLLPPPPATKIISLLPNTFSTLQLGLLKTGLFDAITSAPHTGETFFAPSNWAFQKLGPKVNAFLFSDYGEKYLKALLKYHVVANQTLYSDAFYKAKTTSSLSSPSSLDGNGNEDVQDIPKGQFHVDLPTLLEEKSLSIDVARYGGWITIKINGFSSVAVQDGVAKDGVIHVVSSVLIPPKTPGGEVYEGGEMGVEEFKERFDRFVPEL